MFTIRPYEDADFDQVVGVWERSLPLDAVTSGDFVRRVLLDENLEPGGLLVAVSNTDRRVAGFALCLVLRHPIENVGLLEHRGFITAFGVDPAFQGKGAGRGLLEAAEAFFRARNRREIAIAPYAPGYFVPGVDKAAYASGLAWLQAHGFEEFSEGIAMDAMIGTFDLDERLRAKEAHLATEGITIEPLDFARLAAFMKFMADTMPGDWVEDARRLLGRMASGEAPPTSIFIATDKGSIVGYCKFDGEHFGPFGVADSHQGRGLGTVLLARTLRQMRLEGHHSAFVLWTGERAAKGVYGRLGFTISRRFAILRKKLD
ncbi:MAG: mycothiol synthase [Candidatus Sumerlaeota bacterium]|nr:mycothiol synthase [Candidatus Sumerlaeota bacterium]